MSGWDVDELAAARGCLWGGAFALAIYILAAAVSIIAVVVLR